LTESRGYATVVERRLLELAAISVRYFFVQRLACSLRKRARWTSVMWRGWVVSSCGAGILAVASCERRWSPPYGVRDMASSRASSIKTGCEAAGVEAELEAEVEGGRVGVDEGEEGRSTMAGSGGSGGGRSRRGLAGAVYYREHGTVMKWWGQRARSKRVIGCL
jgi:hypothetical protein